MRAPFWLLRFLPMWDYICPKCRQKVPKDSHECPHCHEQYQTPLKIPPKLYKNRKALEDYVHTYVFAKVSQAHREYLAQFFTVLFSDGFESGDFTAWTGTSGAPSVQGVVTHHGTYALQTTASAWSSNVYAYKTFGSAYTTLYARAYVYVDSAPDTEDYLISIGGPSWPHEIARLGLVNDAGTLKWAFKWLDGGSENSEASAVTLTAGSWHCLEVGVVVDGAAGEAYGYVDGIQAFNKTGLDNNDYGDANQLLCGITYASNGNPRTYYFDCAVAADVYVGPETALQTVTDSVSLSDDSLRHKTLSLYDSLGLNDVLHGNKTLLLADSASLAELVTVVIGEAVKYVTDSVTAADLSNVLKNLKLSDTLTLFDAASTPSRVLQALDAIGTADNNLVNKTLQINETISLAEVIEASAGGAKKTRLFLIIGDLAVQLTGD